MACVALGRSRCVDVDANVWCSASLDDPVSLSAHVIERVWLLIEDVLELVFLKFPLLF